MHIKEVDEPVSYTIAQSGYIGKSEGASGIVPHQSLPSVGLSSLRSLSLQRLKRQNNHAPPWEYHSSVVVCGDVKLFWSNCSLLQSPYRELYLSAQTWWGQPVTVVPCLSHCPVCEISQRLFSIRREENYVPLPDTPGDSYAGECHLVRGYDEKN